MQGEGVVLQLLELAPSERDAAFEKWLGIAAEAGSLPPGPELIGYHASALAPVVAALIETRADQEDVFIDLGCGMGKVTALARLISGARVRGIELQPELISRAPKLEGVEYFVGDVRDAPLDDGTIFYLYNPFSGAVLSQVLSRLRGVAERHAITICTLGLSLKEDWLEERPLEHFWLQIFDSRGQPQRVRARPTEPRLARLANGS
jgi:SAM-dependent methyltransferase